MGLVDAVNKTANEGLIMPGRLTQAIAGEPLMVRN
jgi:hypothetical protein